MKTIHLEVGDTVELNSFPQQPYLSRKRGKVIELSPNKTQAKLQMFDKNPNTGEGSRTSFLYTNVMKLITKNNMN